MAWNSVFINTAPFVSFSGVCQPTLPGAISAQEQLLSSSSEVVRRSATLALNRRLLRAQAGRNPRSTQHRESDAVLALSTKVPPAVAGMIDRVQRSRAELFRREMASHREQAAALRDVFDERNVQRRKFVTIDHNAAKLESDWIRETRQVVADEARARDALYLTSYDLLKAAQVDAERKANARQKARKRRVHANLTLSLAMGVQQVKEFINELARLEGRERRARCVLVDDAQDEFLDLLGFHRAGSLLAGDEEQHRLHKAIDQAIALRLSPIRRDKMVAVSSPTRTTHPPARAATPGGNVSGAPQFFAMLRDVRPLPKFNARPSSSTGAAAGVSLGGVGLSQRLDAPTTTDAADTNAVSVVSSSQRPATPSSHNAAIFPACLDQGRLLALQGTSSSASPRVREDDEATAARSFLRAASPACLVGRTPSPGMMLAASRRSNDLLAPSRASQAKEGSGLRGTSAGSRGPHGVSIATGSGRDSLQPAQQWVEDLARTVLRRVAATS